MVKYMLLGWGYGCWWNDFCWGGEMFRLYAHCVGGLLNAISGQC